MAKNPVLPPPRDEYWNWQLDAACRDSEANIFFADAASTHAEMAKEVCGRCPVARQCLDYALDAEEAHGIWGGLDPDERARIRWGRRLPRRRFDSFVGNKDRYATR